MIPIRLALVVLLFSGTVGCTVVGAPERASDTQNLNAVSDDISALSMTKTQNMNANDPMLETVYPNHDQLPRD